MTPQFEVRDQAKDALCLIGLAVEKVLDLPAWLEGNDYDLSVVLDDLGNANDILRDKYNLW